jgi:hypothetical protein
VELLLGLVLAHHPLVAHHLEAFGLDLELLELAVLPVLLHESSP